MVGQDDNNEGGRPSECVEHVWQFDAVSLIPGEGSYQDFSCTPCPAYMVVPPGGIPLRLAREERKELVGHLASEGMSTRAIAPIVGVHHDTVAEDLKPTVGFPTGDRPAAVTSIDGRQRPASAPRSTPRRAITDQFFDAAVGV